MSADLAKTIDAAFDQRETIGPSTKGAVREAVEQALDLLDRGTARVAEKTANGALQITDRLILSPELDEVTRLFGVAKAQLKPVGSSQITSDSPPGKLLWQSLGMESQSVDVEGGDICIDLNEGRVPADLRGAFDLAINAGTTEHVANQGNAFSVIHGLVRVGGLMYHQLPAFGDVPSASA